jgi:hypothetical protein
MLHPGHLCSSNRVLYTSERVSCIAGSRRTQNEFNYHHLHLEGLGINLKDATQAGSRLFKEHTSRLLRFLGASIYG